jgi:hypothetical protein
MDLFGNEFRPTRLMVGAQPGTVVIEEILVQQQMIPPKGVGLKIGGASIDRAPPVLVSEKDAGQTVDKLLSYFEAEVPESMRKNDLPPCTHGLRQLLDSFVSTSSRSLVLSAFRHIGQQPLGALWQNSGDEA